MEKRINFFNFFKKEKSVDKEKFNFNMDTFCASPFVSCYVGPENNLSPCCINTITEINTEKDILKSYNHPKMQELRKDLLNGVKHPSCETCWKNESIGLTSLRQEQNRIFQKEFNTINEIINKDYSVSRLYIKYLDVRFSNKCNLKCRTCAPSYSSSWAADYKILNPNLPIVKKIVTDVTVKDFHPILDTVTHIYFAGGEPLIMDEHYEILDYLLANHRNNNVSIFYNTNFSKLTYREYDVINYWKKFKWITIGASLDGNHERGEYIRKNISWTRVIDNRKRLLEFPEIRFYISCTLSILNSYNIIELHKEWVSLGFIQPENFNVNILFGPPPFCIRDLPDSHKLILIKLYREHITWLESFPNTERTIAGFESAINLLLEQRDDSEFWKKEWVRVVEGVDNIRGENFYKTFPELADLRHEK